MLTPKDLALVTNPEVLLAKNRIIQEVYELFGRLADSYRLQAAALPPAVITMHPKIAKGENYEDLPWVMLDYPRHFAGSHTFAIRTMFWWGNYFSLHLLLQGRYMQWLDEKQIAQASDGWFFSTAAQPWVHKIMTPESIPLSLLTPDRIATQRIQNNFYKLSTQLPLSEWNTAERFLQEKFERALQFVKVERKEEDSVKQMSA